MNEYERLYRIAENLKVRYPKGTRIEVISMGEDPRPIPSGTRGTVEVVDDMATVHCTFDNGRYLGLAYGEDHFRVLTPEECYEEKMEKNLEKYIDKVNNEVIPNISVKNMIDAYEQKDMSYPTEVIKMLHEAFVEVYEGIDLNHSMGMVKVPGVVKAADGKFYPALMDIDCASSGEHWGTVFFTPQGIYYDADENPEVQKVTSGFVPYQYWYTPYMQCDCHVDWEACPLTALEMLENATGEKFIQDDGGINY